MAERLATDFKDHPVTGYINSLTARNSKLTMLSALKSALAVAQGIETSEVDPMAVYEFAWHGIGPSEMKALKAALLDRYSSRTAAKAFTAVRGVMGACFDQSLIDADQLMRIERVKGVKVRADQKTARRLTDGEIISLAKSCAADEGPAGSRDDAIIGLGITQGPRIGELTGFQLEDYDPTSGDLIIQNGKGGKARTIRAANSTKDSLDEWIEIRGSDPGPLFCRIKKAGKIEIAPISSQGLSGMLKKRGEDAGVKAFTFHDLRRTFVSNGWAIGIPGSQLQEVAGHSSMATTAAYDRGDLETALTNTSGRLHYPSQRRSD